MWGGVSPSRTAIAITDFDENLPPNRPVRNRIFRGAEPNPIAEKVLPKGSYVVGITDSGFATCSIGGNDNCSQLRVEGLPWNGGKPLLFLSSREALLWGEGRKTLISATPDGGQRVVADLPDYLPPFHNTESVSISATEPRRVLFFATGCYLGDFDDCYGVFFHEFVVLDLSTGQALLKADADANSSPVISPDGHTVAVRSKNTLTLYTIP